MPSSWVLTVSDTVAGTPTITFSGCLVMNVLIGFGMLLVPTTGSACLFAPPRWIEEGIGEVESAGDNRGVVVPFLATEAETAKRLGPSIRSMVETPRLCRWVSTVVDTDGETMEGESADFFTKQLWLQPRTGV